MSRSGSENFSPPARLSVSHDHSQFTCGIEPLEIFLRKHALTSEASGSVRTYVVCRPLSRVIGYYSLAVGAVEHANASARVVKGMARHPVPVMLLARLAVDVTAQGLGLGKALLKDALMRTAAASEIAGIRALLVHAKDDEARAWYQRFDFEPGPTDPYHLFLLMKDIRAALKAGG